MIIFSRAPALTFGVCVLLILLMSSEAAAQFAWPRTTDGSSIKFEDLTPSLAHQTAYLEISGNTMSLSGHFQVGEGTFFIGEIPYTSTTIKYSFPYAGSPQSTSKGSVGNIYLGLEFVGEDSPFFGEVGVRIPTISEDNMGASTLGILDDVNRWEIYIANLLALQGALNYRPVFESGIAMFLRAGPSIWIPTKSGGGGDVEVLVDYGAGIGFETEMFRVGAGMSGRVIVTEKSMFFDRSSIHHMEFGANLRVAQFRPGVFLRFPMEKEFKDAISYTLGISLSYVFESR